MKLRSGKTYTFNEVHKISSRKATQKFNFKEHFTELMLCIILFVIISDIKCYYYLKQNIENIQISLNKMYYLYIFPNFYDVNITTNDIFTTFKLPEDDLFHNKYDFRYNMLDI